jgi:hypothetical protein
MKQRAVATVLVAALSAGAAPPALAGGITVPFFTNYFHKMHAKHEEKKEIARRQDAYRDWFYHKNGYYPTHDQFRQWYVETYHTDPG